MLEPLIVAVECIRGMVLNSIWEKARLVWLLNLTAISTVGTCPIKGILHHIIWYLLICYAPELLFLSIYFILLAPIIIIVNVN